jgi:hypothetical protein
MRGYFERRGREGFAESAEEDKDNTKVKPKKRKQFLKIHKNFKN